MTDVALGYTTDSQAVTEGVKEVLKCYVINLGHRTGNEPKS